MYIAKKTAKAIVDVKIKKQMKFSALRAATLKVLMYNFLLVFAACLFMEKPLMAQDGIRGNLVSVDWLAKNLNNHDVLLLDASPIQIYTAKHIAGAVNVNLFIYGFQDMPLAEIEQLYQSWGISPDKKIIIYDQGATMLATRQFFSLYYHGFPAENLFILDGGLSKWEEKGMPVTQNNIVAPEKGSFKILKLNEDVNAELPEFLTASGDPVNNVLVEALGADWHYGEVQFFNKPGHIPNAVLLPSNDFYNPDKTFKSAEEINKILTFLNIKPEQQIYSHCGGGISASVPFFALKFMLNYPRVKLYTESQLGWLNDERELPFWTYDAPFLMRETKWLQSWGSKMLRMYGASKLSVIDVRPADAFNQGHIPFALNIQADVFKNNITDPEKLAEILGPSGVNESYEAVVISGAGLTKEAALAFVMLEKLGQKKVSVFIDSLDKWTKLGFEVTKDSTVVGPKKSSQDLTITPTNYSGNFRKDVIITDPASTQGVYPRVFIASGINVPAKTQDGKVVHIPYTDLLNADGTPKAAKDIWNIMVKAGVPRYAELVCFSDDPGEAAANYFILKLMGYPDIKVLVI